MAQRSGPKGVTRGTEVPTALERFLQAVDVQRAARGALEAAQGRAEPAYGAALAALAALGADYGTAEAEDVLAALEAARAAVTPYRDAYRDACNEVRRLRPLVDYQP